MARCLENQGFEIVPIRVLRACPRPFRLKRSFYKYVLKLNYRWDIDALMHQYLSYLASKQLKALGPFDLVFSPGCNPVPLTYLECEQPLAFWGDAGFLGLNGFLPTYSNLCAENIRDGQMLERRLLDKSALAVFASDWAVDSVMQNYHAKTANIQTLPFGPNIDCQNTLEDIKLMLKARPENKCKLLFMGTNWDLKNGDLAIMIARQLNEAGLPTELIMIGSRPSSETMVPPFVKVLGFISKSDRSGTTLIKKLLAESHFLISPSKAECFGVSFCEASSFAVPSLATRIGGIPAVITDGVNGMTFSSQEQSEAYASYIHGLFQDYPQYRKLALSSFSEYENRLSWAVSGRSLAKLLRQIVAQK